MSRDECRKLYHGPDDDDGDCGDDGGDGDSGGIE